MRKLLFIGVIGVLIFFGGVIAQTSPGWTNTKTQNMTLNIVCSENQLLFRCRCSDNITFDYNITGYWNVSKTSNINYTAKMIVNDNIMNKSCAQGKNESTISYVAEPHDEILTDLRNWLATEYNANKVIPPEAPSYGGGTIKVVK